MKKLLNPWEWLGTGIQLMIFAALLPFLSILFGIIMESAPAAKDSFSAAVLSFLPYSDAIQNTVTGLKLSGDGMSILTYLAALMDTISGNVIAAMYLGSWLFAFRIIFKESIAAGFLKIRGLPILQIVCGLFFGALTFVLLQEEMTAILATLFVFTLDVVLTIIFVHKSVWKKILDLAVNLSMQSLLAALTIGYFAVLASCVQGHYANVTQAIAAIGTVTALWLVYLITQYLVTEK